MAETPRTWLIHKALKVLGWTEQNLTKADISPRWMSSVRASKKVGVSKLGELADHFNTNLTPAKKQELGLPECVSASDLFYAGAQRDAVDELIRFFNETKAKDLLAAQPNEINHGAAPVHFVYEMSKKSATEWTRVREALVEAFEVSLPDERQDFETKFDAARKELGKSPPPDPQSLLVIAEEFVKGFQNGHDLVCELLQMDSSDGLRPAIERLLKSDGALERIRKGLRRLRNARKESGNDTLSGDECALLTGLCDLATWVDLPETGKQQLEQQIESRRVSAPTLDKPLMLIHFAFLLPKLLQENQRISSSEIARDASVVPLHRQERQIRHTDASFPESGMDQQDPIEHCVRDLARGLNIANFREEPYDTVVDLIVRRLRRWADDDESPEFVVLFVSHGHHEKVPIVLRTLKDKLFCVTLPKGTQQAYLEVIDLRNDILNRINAARKNDE